jgi:hypothetical protein
MSRCQQFSETAELILGERVHRVDDDGADAGFGVLIRQPQGTC